MIARFIVFYAIFESPEILSAAMTWMKVDDFVTGKMLIWDFTRIPAASKLIVFHQHALWLLSFFPVEKRDYGIRRVRLCFIRHIFNIVSSASPLSTAAVTWSTDILNYVLKYVKLKKNDVYFIVFQTSDSRPSCALRLEHIFYRRTKTNRSCGEHTRTRYCSETSVDGHCSIADTSSCAQRADYQWRRSCDVKKVFTVCSVLRTLQSCSRFRTATVSRRLQTKHKHAINVRLFVDVKHCLREEINEAVVSSDSGSWTPRVRNSPDYYTRRVLGPPENGYTEIKWIGDSSYRQIYFVLFFWPYSPTDTCTRR